MCLIVGISGLGYYFLSYVPYRSAVTKFEDIVKDLQEKNKEVENQIAEAEKVIDSGEEPLDSKKLEELKRKGREYLKYLDELEILRREGVNTPKREEELIKKIKEREEIGKKYAEYKRNLKKWIKSLKDNEIINLLIN